LLKVLKSCTSGSEILLVGHMPSLAEHLAAFIGATTPQGLPLDKGAVASVEFETLRAGVGHLCWLMRQQELRAVAS
jgi:phosphohistidine phosphatase